MKNERENGRNKRGKYRVTGSSAEMENLDEESQHLQSEEAEDASISQESHQLTINPDTVTVGKIIPPEQRITYSWHDINVFTNMNVSSQRKYICCGPKIDSTNLMRKQILNSVHGIAYPGELMAILGSSGAGKTTLLNALTFRSLRKISVTGTRCVNGNPVTLGVLTSQSAYVQQDDLFIGNLTVREHLVFQALVRMDRNISRYERMKRVDEVINELALTKCSNTKIGIPGRLVGISGGERKRLSFAAEVLTNPCLMFCDEPTSGLDSFMALNVIQVLKNLSNSGKTIICTIHQPSSELYSMFDKLLLMAEGRTAFLGTPNEADEFFKSLGSPCPKNYNPADYYIQLLAIAPDREESCRQGINMICNKFERSNLGVKLALESAPITKYSDDDDLWLNGEAYRNPYKASWWNQFTAVLWRSWLSVIKEPLLVKVRFIQTAVIALMIGFVYFDQKLDQDGVMNMNGVLFLFLTSMTFQNSVAVITVFCTELPIFLRENRNGMYRTDVYFLSKTLADTPIFIFIPILFMCISYFMIGLNMELPSFFLACLIMVLVANVATSFGYLISCLATSVSMALSIGPPVLIPFLLFGGFFLNVNSTPVYLEWLSYLSWFKYGNEALLINQWNDVTNITCPANNSTCFRDGRMILESFHFEEGNFMMDVISLVTLLFGFRFVAFLALLWKTYNYGK